MASSSKETGELENPVRGVRVSRAIWPILIGLAVVGYMFWREFQPGALDHVKWTWHSALWICLALLLMMGRDVGYMWRIRILSEGRLSLLQAFRIIMLWEFTSAITPSALGGTSVAILYVTKEGIPVGRSSAIVMATSFLDELYFLIMFPLLLAVVGVNKLFSIAGEPFSPSSPIFIAALIGYALKFAYVVILSYGFFVNPRGLKWLLLKIFKLPFLRRWKQGAHRAGSEIIESSREFRTKPFSYWFRAFFATFVSWTSRYWVANAIILAFFLVPHQFLLFARQLVMWIMMLVAPTPGGSGFAEYVFTRFLGEFLPVEPALVGSVVVVLALLWRLATYYPYLVMGAIIFPRWMRRHFFSGRHGVSSSMHGESITK